MPNDDGMMTPAEAALAAREAFLSAERHAHNAISAAAPDNTVLFELANAVADIAYGLKVQSPTAPGAGMTPETETALRNYDSLIRSKGLDEVALDWETGTLIWGDGGSEMEELIRPGFTPGTRG